MCILIRIFIAVKRNCKPGSSYKERHVIGAYLQFQRSSRLSSQQGAWWHADRHSSGQGADSSTPWFTGSIKWTGLSFWCLKAHLLVTRFIQQGHSYTHKDIPHNSVTPYVPSIQTNDSVRASPSQTSTLCNNNN